jgi:hypothetical protein
MIRPSSSAPSSQNNGQPVFLAQHPDATQWSVRKKIIAGSVIHLCQFCKFFPAIRAVAVDMVLPLYQLPVVS